MQIVYGTQTDQGKVRSSNEDSFAADASLSLFLVADGMGGHAAGEIASRLAVAAVREWMEKHDGDRGAEELLREAVVRANTLIYETQRGNPQLAGMGSTLTTLLLHDSLYIIAHVGDSRAYRLRDGVLEQLTRDHSLVWHLYESGILTKGDLPGHPQKNLITRSIGSHPQVEIDIMKGDACQGDVYLLCSDGLTDVVTDEGIRAILSDEEKSPQEMGDTLVKRANASGGPDNVTVVVVKLDPGDV